MSDARAREPWLVWSNEHRAFWAPARCGYTARIEKAGRYTKAEAETICNGANYRANSTIHEGTPPEICMPAPEAITAAIQQERDDVVAALSDACGISLPKGWDRIVIDFDTQRGAGKAFEVLRRLWQEAQRNEHKDDSNG